MKRPCPMTASVSNCSQSATIMADFSGVSCRNSLRKSGAGAQRSHPMPRALARSELDPPASRGNGSASWQCRLIVALSTIRPNSPHRRSGFTADVPTLRFGGNHIRASAGMSRPARSAQRLLAAAETSRSATGQKSSPPSIGDHRRSSDQSMPKDDCLLTASSTSLIARFIRSSEPVAAGRTP
jgi:hypothetical protein